MTLFDRVAEHNGYKDWEELVSKVTKRKKKFTIPNWMHYNNRELMHHEILHKIKSSNLKLVVTNDIVFISK